MTISRSPSIESLHKVVSQIKTFYENENDSSGLINNLYDTFENKEKITSLFHQAIKKAKRNHSKEEIIKCMLDVDSNCKIPLIYFAKAFK